MDILSSENNHIILGKNIFLYIGVYFFLFKEYWERSIRGEFLKDRGNLFYGLRGHKYFFLKEEGVKFFLQQKKGFYSKSRGRKKIVFLRAGGIFFFKA